MAAIESSKFFFKKVLVLFKAKGSRKSIIYIFYINEGGSYGILVHRK